jgi:hypothetical protein
MESGRRVSRTTSAHRRPGEAALHQEGRADGRPGRERPLRQQPDLSGRSLRAHAPDLGHHRRAAQGAGHQRILGLVGPLLGPRAGRRRRHRLRPPVHGLRLRPLHRLLGRRRRRAQNRCGDDSRRRARLAAAPGADARNGATVLCCTPTYALRLAEVAHEIGFDMARSR